LKLARRARKAEAKAQEHREREERRVLDYIDSHGTRWIVQ
jgi:hypothetical protein